MDADYPTVEGAADGVDLQDLVDRRVIRVHEQLRLSAPSQRNGAQPCDGARSPRSASTTACGRRHTAFGSVAEERSLPIRVMIEDSNFSNSSGVMGGASTPGGSANAVSRAPSTMRAAPRSFPS
jgi:hypothetical protein